MRLKKGNRVHLQTEAADFTDEDLEFDDQENESTSETDDEDDEGAEESEEQEELPSETVSPQFFPRRVKGPASSRMNTERAAISTVVNSKAASRTDERICLTTKLDPDLHARLKIHSIKTHTAYCDLIESWIKQNCPEV